MPTTPESWAAHKTVAGLVKHACSGHRPSSVTGIAHWCILRGRYPRDWPPCAHPVDERCLLVGLPDGMERCQWFEKTILPAAPEPVVAEYAYEFPSCEASQHRLGRLHGQMAGRRCPDCGGALKRHRRCDACKKVAQRERDRLKKRRARGTGEPVPSVTDLEASETTDSQPISGGTR